MRVTRVVVFIIALAIILSSTASAGKAVKLQFKFKPGDIDKYRMTIGMKFTCDPPIPNVSANGISMKMSALMKQKVLGVLPDGSAKIRISYEDFNLSLTGVKKPETGKIPSTWVTVRMDRTGQLLGIEEIDPALNMSGFNGAQFSQIMTQMAFFGTLPKWELEVGNKWMYPIPSFMGCTEAKIISTLEAAAVPYGKYTAARIAQTMEGRLDVTKMMQVLATSMGASVPADASAAFSSVGGEITMDGKGDTFFSAEKGKLLDVDGNLKIFMDLDMSKLPEAEARQNIPPRIKMGVNLDLQVKKI